MQANTHKLFDYPLGKPTKASKGIPANQFQDQDEFTFVGGISERRPKSDRFEVSIRGASSTNLRQLAPPRLLYK